MNRTRNQFSFESLVSLVRGCFQSFTQVLPRVDTKGHSYKISITDCLMSALAVFTFKYPSLLQFDQDLFATESTLRHNLRTLFGVSRAPCDTTMRERLDGVSLAGVRESMKAVLARLQRGKALERWKFLNKFFLVSLDGTGFFSSSEIHCDQCCEKHHRNGKVTYHHQMVVGSIVCPGEKAVLPIGFEAIVKGDGEEKNDCERNASKRWLELFRKDHPQLPTVIVADGLSANDPFIAMLEKHRCSYILVCKTDDHRYLWDWFKNGESPDKQTLEQTIQGVHKRYQWMENVPLNGSSQRRVTVVHYQETTPARVLRNGKTRKEKTYTCGWITDLPVTQETVRQIVEGGRARWKIENETFNTLKNQGYNFEHNYGHGFKTLSNLLAGLMLLAFLLDQVAEAVNVTFKKVLEKMKQRSRLWRKLQQNLECVYVETWDQLYSCILDPPRFRLGSANTQPE